MNPCPTCGSDTAHEIFPAGISMRRVICNYNNGGCGTSTAAGDSDEEAIAKWNRRPNGINPSELANAFLETSFRQQCADIASRYEIHLLGFPNK